ncbi:hypothetical protein [Ahniella affigens]|uniref:hypothetical protein n=1 Tax=Ahniella affigens TaxID=2021234 RepID=UPI0011B251C5|nr:hypothetical protein [Ahniella affigens]
MLRARYWVHILVVLAYLTNVSLFLMGVGRNGSSGAAAFVLMGPAAAIIIAVMRGRLFAVAPIIQALRLPNAATLLPRTAVALAVLALAPPIFCSWYFGINGLLLVALALATIALGLNFVLVFVVSLLVRALIWLLEYLVPDLGSRLFDGLAVTGNVGLLAIAILLIAYAWRRDSKQWRQLLRPEPSVFQIAHLDLGSGVVQDIAPEALAADTADQAVAYNRAANRRDEFDDEQDVEQDVDLDAESKDKGIDDSELTDDAPDIHASLAAEALARVTQSTSPGHALLTLTLGQAPGWPTKSILLVAVGAALVQFIVGYQKGAAYLPPAAIVLIVLYTMIPMAHAYRLINRLVGGHPRRVLDFSGNAGASRHRSLWWVDQAASSDTLILLPGFPRGAELRSALMRQTLAWSLHSTVLMAAALLAVLLVAMYQIGIDDPVLLMHPRTWLVLLVLVGVANLASVCMVLVWFAHRWLERTLVVGALVLTVGLATLPIGVLTGVNWISGWLLPPLLAGIWLLYLLPSRTQRLLPRGR